MKIALICTEKLPVPPVAGGAVQLYIQGIVPYLAKEHEITVFCIQHPDLPHEEVREGIRYIRVPAGSKMKYVRNLKEKLAQETFDLIHVFNRPLWISLLSEDLPDTKFSLSIHNEMFHPEKIAAGEAGRCIERVEFINTVSQFIAHGIQSMYPEAQPKLNVVYSGVDVDRYAPFWTEQGMADRNVLKEKYNLQDYNVVLYVGRLSVKKGVHVLLKAMKQVMESREKTALMIVGSKWYGKNEQDSYTKKLIALSEELPGPVQFTGFLTPEEIPAYYNIGDVFVCSSQWQEPLARVHYEAMAAGLPIITTRRGGNAEVMIQGENGMVIDDYSNASAFAESIQYLLDHPEEAEAMGKNGRRMAEEKYTWQRVAHDVLKPLKQ